jgi:pimeloyl-ACP methyl ester carboxylesterase
VRAAHDLHDLLDLAGEHGPYVLVGHSIGGTYALTYAAQYPQQVAGMVLLDSSSPQQFAAIPSYASQYAVIHRIEALTPSLNRLGLGRIIAAVASPHLPPDAADQVTALTVGARGARSTSAEWQVLPTVFRQAQALTTFDNRPLVVLTASESQKTQGWAAAQNRLAALSTSSVHQVVASTHMGLLDDQHGSAAAVAAIDHVLAAVRSHPRAVTR